MADIKSAYEIAMEKINKIESATPEERLKWKFIPKGEELAGAAVIGKFFQRQIESGFLVEAIDRICIADQQVAPVVIGGFRSDGFEGDLGADACDITKRNANPASH